MEVVTINKNVQGELPCFAGTRIPVSTLLVYLKNGYSIAEFLADFPSVKKRRGKATSNDLEDLLPLVPKLLQAIKNLQPCTLIRVR